VRLHQGAADREFDPVAGVIDVLLQRAPDSTAVGL
jgi:hypothetical protein